MAEFYSRLLADPRKAIDAASITRVDELGNGYDDFGNLIAPKFEAPQQTWGETAMGVATAPARMATALAGSVSPYGPEGWQVPPIIGEGVNALTAVGDAYTQGMSDDEMRNRALGMASFMFAGGGAAAGRGGMVAANASKEGAVPAIVASQADSLPMDQASIRAYHGMDGPVLGGAFDGPSFWATDRPATAARYAEGLHRGPKFEAIAPNVLPVDMAGKIYDATGLENKIGIFDIARQNARESGADIIKYIGGNYEAINRGTVRSATTGETLFSNSDSRPALLASALDMSPEARLARAREMGFDTEKTWYHGSPQGDLETITPGYDEPGAWFTTDKKNAANYARGDNPGLYETYLKTQNPLKVNFDYDARGDLVPTIGGEPLDILDNIGIVKYAQNRGFDSVHFPDGNFSESGDTMVIFDPSNIRSTNAAFDPSKAGSANLLAANADSKPAMIAGALGQERIDPERIKAAIRNRMRGDK